ncbi:MAG: histone deacetylase, partial [Gloeobacteraceae cyanobacterium ES-bin-316]|nr:histone deacetylase [Ferruginibacter sp.]
EEYLQILQENLHGILAAQKPDFVFYLAGVDILETDKLGKLKVTLEGCKERDRLVLSTLASLRLPCVIAMGGGYSEDVKIITEAHCNTFRQAKELYKLD